MSEFRTNTEGLIIGERHLPSPPVPSVTPTPTPTPTSTPAPSQYDTGYANLHTMIQDDNPVGFWTFPEGVSGSSDVMRSGVSLFTIDASKFVDDIGYGGTGATGVPVDFDGMDSGSPHMTLIPDGSSYSIEFMLHMDAAIEDIPDTVTCIYTGAYAFGFGPVGYWDGSGSDTRPRGLNMLWEGNSGPVGTAIDFVYFNHWNHIAIVVDASVPVARVYANGQLAGVMNDIMLLPYLFPMMTGSYSDSLGPLQTFASMDTLAIYHRQLTAQEIADRAHLVLTSNSPKPAPIAFGEAPEPPRPSPTPTPTPNFSNPSFESDPWVVDFSDTFAYDEYITVNDNQGVPRVNIPRESRIVEAGPPGTLMCLATNASVLMDYNNMNWNTHNMSPIADQATAQVVINLPSRQKSAQVFLTEYINITMEKGASGDWLMRIKLPNDYTFTDVVVNVQNSIGNTRMFVLTVVKANPDGDNYDYRIYINGGQVATVTYDNSTAGQSDYLRNPNLIGGNFGIGQFTFFDGSALSNSEVYYWYRSNANVNSLVPPEDFPYLYAHAKGAVEIADVDNGLVADFISLNGTEDLLLLTDTGSSSGSGGGSYGGTNGFVRYTLFNKDTGFINPTTKQNHYVDDLVDVDQSYLDLKAKVAVAQKVSLRDELDDDTRTPVSSLPIRFQTRNGFLPGDYNLLGIKPAGLGQFVAWTESGEVFRTVTNGYTWENTITLGTYIYDILVKVGNPEEFLVFTADTIWKTTDFGLNYTSIAAPFGGGFRRGGNAASNTTYLVNFGSEIWRSDDGETWLSTAMSSNTAPSTMVWHETAGLFTYFDHDYSNFDVYTSPTGEVWTNVNSTFIPPRTGWMYAPSYYNGVITVLHQTNVNTVVTSTDGINFARDLTVTSYNSPFNTPIAVIQSTENPDEVFMIGGSGPLLVFNRSNPPDWKVEMNQFANNIPQFLLYGPSGMVIAGFTEFEPHAFSIFSTISDDG